VEIPFLDVPGVAVPSSDVTDAVVAAAAATCSCIVTDLPSFLKEGMVSFCGLSTYAAAEVLLASFAAYAPI